MRFEYDDGGREDAGYRGQASDCAVRSAAIVTGRPYREIYDAVNELAKLERLRGGRARSSARLGVRRTTMDRVMRRYGFIWVATMGIGTGTTVHLRDGELPGGRLVVRLSKHFCAVVDGVIRDTHDPSRDGTRAVYGYWIGE